MDLDILARKLGVNSDAAIRKAEELMRLTEIRSGCSTLSSLGLTGSCKAVMCLELAAVLCGHHVERATAVRLSGTTKKSYSTSIKVLECLLDLQPRTTIGDLAVQFGCTEVKALATQVLTKYQETQLGHDRADLSTVFFNSVALYAACRNQKVKVDKTKLLNVSGAKRTAFDRLMSQMETVIQTLTVSSQTKPLICEIDNFPHDLKLDSSADVAMIQEDRTSDESIEPYEIWKQRILSEARQALLKTLPKSSLACT